MAQDKNSRPRRTPVRNLPYPSGTDAFKITPTFSKEEMRILDVHEHGDITMKLVALQTRCANAERSLNTVLNTQVATIFWHRATKDPTTDVLKLPADFDTDPSVSMAITSSYTQRFFVCNVYSKEVDHDDLQIVRIRKRFWKVKD